MFTQVGAGEHTDHTRHGARHFVINGENSRMGIGASQKANMDHARQFDVVAVACLPLHQPLGAHARHCSADALMRELVRVHVQ